MLFRLHPQTPKFRVFELLNEELIYFLNKSINQQRFGRRLFSYTPVGKACWNNFRKPTGKNDLTRDKFKKLFLCLKGEEQLIREQLYQVMIDNQNLEIFFSTPNPNLISFLSQESFEAFKVLATHLYESTKELQPIINQAGGVNILTHFLEFRSDSINGNVCKACGMSTLADIRANIPDEKQWRSDYDHQLCKSDYPLFSVHPDNLVPICDTCNKKAKGDDNLFFKNNNIRFSFYPYTESAYNCLELKIINLRDPVPIIELNWNTSDPDLISKLDTWNDIYEIKNRVEGEFRCLDETILDIINPIDFNDFQVQVLRHARPVSDETLKRKPWAYWYQKFFCELNSTDKAAFWQKSRFFCDMAEESAIYILNRTNNPS